MSVVNRYLWATVAAGASSFDFMYQWLHADNHQNQQVLGTGNAPALFDPTVSGPPANEKDYIAVAEGDRRFRNKGNLLPLGADWNVGPVTLSFAGGHQYAVLLQEPDLDSSSSVPGYIQDQHVRTPYKVDTAELRVVSNSEGFYSG
jgi:iron complex outermembrane receptor protein